MGVGRKRVCLVGSVIILLIILLYFNLNKDGKDIPLKAYREMKTMKIYKGGISGKTLDNKDDINVFFNDITKLKKIKPLERDNNKEINIEIYSEENKYETLTLGEEYLVYKDKHYGGNDIKSLRNRAKNTIISKGNLEDVLKQSNTILIAEDISAYGEHFKERYLKDIFKDKNMEFKEYNEKLKEEWRFPRYKIVTRIDFNKNLGFDPFSKTLIDSEENTVLYVIDNNNILIENFLGENFTLVGETGFYNIIKDNILSVKNNKKGDLYYLFEGTSLKVRFGEKTLDLIKDKEKITSVITGVTREEVSKDYKYKNESYTLWYNFEDNNEIEVKVYDNYVEYDNHKYEIKNVLYTLENLLKKVGGI
ncbi:hypothetical protein [Clostridium hydrogeniformans]|uniref:hypothetical protein n=1 Tax=Clostridium hydrogeniformans TaxID=349933 RepID=UPI00047FEB72|nr:hypothetical protein [Clostridium hydrogeniformans]